MPARQCTTCSKAKAVLRRPKTGALVCRECFYFVFEEEVHRTIVDARLFQPGDKVAIGASGGKDSTVLAHVMKTLNERHAYGLELFLLSIDEGITGYRDDSLETVKRNQQQYDLPLTVLSYSDLYGWTMDDIVKAIGNRNNFLRGDIARLERCTEICTRGPDPTVLGEGEGGCGSKADEFGGSGIRRSKPFKYAYEKEIVMYAYFKSLDYFSTECIYSPEAYRGYARVYLRDLELIRPSAVIDIIHSGEAMKVGGEVKRAVQQTCTRCGYMSSNELCKACLLLEGLNRGTPSLGVRSATGKAAREVEAVREKDAAGLGRVIPKWEKVTASASAAPAQSVGST